MTSEPQAGPQQEGSNISDARWNLGLQQASDELLAEALEPSHVPALMAALSHVLGNTAHLSGAIRPLVVPLAEEEDGLEEAQREQARALALRTLVDYRDAGCPELAPLTEAQVLETMNYITGVPAEPEHLELLREELNLYGEDRRRLEIDTTALPRDYRVLIVGAGMSGILAAVRLKQAGIPFLMIDKNPEFTGTWYENTYPGCAVDSPNHLYNYIFAPEHQWPGHYSARAELNRYFNRVVDDWQLRGHARLSTRLVSAVYDEATNLWRATLDCNGDSSSETFSGVISAVGQLNTPRLPDIPGVGDFAGVAFHSARWQHQHDLDKQRVAVIGTGCSATQFVPELAPGAAHLTVFQRTPNWLVPAPEYRVPSSEAELWCFRNIPFYDRWYRLFLYRARALHGLLPFLYGDDNWDGPDDAVSENNALLRDAMTEYIREQTGDHPIFNDLVPDYPPGGKRPVLDDGSWISTLLRDDVELVTTPIERIEAAGIRTADGRLHEVDALIYGTGFAASDFLTNMQIVGRNGVELHQQWQGDAQAYLGVTIPGFPNFYCLYGPNTNIVTGSSIIFFSECEMRYIMGCLKMQIEDGRQVVECRRDVHDRYNAEIDAVNRQRAWGADKVSSWYKSATGRVSQNWPGDHYQYWQRTRAPDPADFI